MSLCGSESWSIGTVDSLKCGATDECIKSRGLIELQNEVLRRIGEEWRFMNIYTKRRDRIIVHKLKHKRLLQSVVEGTTEGKNHRRRGRFECTSISPDYEGL